MNSFLRNVKSINIPTIKYVSQKVTPSLSTIENPKHNFHNETRQYSPVRSQSLPPNLNPFRVTLEQLRPKSFNDNSIPKTQQKIHKLLNQPTFKTANKFRKNFGQKIRKPHEKPKSKQNIRDVICRVPCIKPENDAPIKKSLLSSVSRNLHTSSSSPLLQKASSFGTFKELYKKSPIKALINLTEEAKINSKSKNFIRKTPGKDKVKFHYLTENTECKQCMSKNKKRIAEFYRKNEDQINPFTQNRRYFSSYIHDPMQSSSNKPKEVVVVKDQNLSSAYQDNALTLFSLIKLQSTKHSAKFVPTILYKFEAKKKCEAYDFSPEEAATMYDPYPLEMFQEDYIHDIIPAESLAKKVESCPDLNENNWELVAKKHLMTIKPREKDMFKKLYEMTPCGVNLNDNDPSNVATNRYQRKYKKLKVKAYKNMMMDTDKRKSRKQEKSKIDNKKDKSNNNEPRESQNPLQGPSVVLEGTNDALKCSGLSLATKKPGDDDSSGREPLACKDCNYNKNDKKASKSDAEYIKIYNDIIDAKVQPISKDANEKIVKDGKDYVKDIDVQKLVAPFIKYSWHNIHGNNKNKYGPDHIVIKNSPKIDENNRFIEIFKARTEKYKELLNGKQNQGTRAIEPPVLIQNQKENNISINPKDSLDKNTSEAIDTAPKVEIGEQSKQMIASAIKQMIEPIIEKEFLKYEEVKYALERMEKRLSFTLRTLKPMQSKSMESCKRDSIYLRYPWQKVRIGEQEKLPEMVDPLEKALDKRDPVRRVFIRTPAWRRPELQEEPRSHSIFFSSKNNCEDDADQIFKKGKKVDCFADLNQKKKQLEAEDCITPAKTDLCTPKTPPCTKENDIPMNVLKCAKCPETPMLKVWPPSCSIQDVNAKPSCPKSVCDCDEKKCPEVNPVQCMQTPCQECKPSVEPFNPCSKKVACAEASPEKPKNHGIEGMKEIVKPDLTKNEPCPCCEGPVAETFIKLPKTKPKQANPIPKKATEDEVKNRYCDSEMFDKEMEETKKMLEKQEEILKKQKATTCNRAVIFKKETKKDWQAVQIDANKMNDKKTIKRKPKKCNSDTSQKQNPSRGPPKSCKSATAANNQCQMLAAPATISQDQTLVESCTNKISDLCMMIVRKSKSGKKAAPIVVTLSRSQPAIGKFGGSSGMSIAGASDGNDGHRKKSSSDILDFSSLNLFKKNAESKEKGIFGWALGSKSRIREKTPERFLNMKDCSSLAKMSNQGSSKSNKNNCYTKERKSQSQPKINCNKVSDEASNKLRDCLKYLREKDFRTAEGTNNNKGPYLAAGQKKNPRADKGSSQDPKVKKQNSGIKDKKSKTTIVDDKAKDHCKKPKKDTGKKKEDDPCKKQKGDPCKKKNDDPGKKQKEDPCKKKDDDPCKKQKEDTSKKKEDDPCKKQKEDPCKKKDDDPCKKQKEDPCKKKDDDPCKKQKEDPCKKKEDDPCKKQKKDPCKKDDDPCKKPKEDPCKKKDDDPCKKQKEDPCKKKEDDPCKKQKEDPCKKKDDDPCKKQKEDPCKKKEDDPCKKQKKDPCKKDDDPCKKPKEDPCKKKEDDPCKKQKEDPCKKKEDDPCKKQKEDPGKKKDDDPCKKPKEDPCKKKDDQGKKPEKDPGKKKKTKPISCKTKTDICKQKQSDPSKKKSASEHRSEPCIPCKKEDYGKQTTKSLSETKSEPCIPCKYEDYSKKGKGDSSKKDASKGMSLADCINKKQSKDGTRYQPKAAKSKSDDPCKESKKDPKIEKMNDCVKKRSKKSIIDDHEEDPCKKPKGDASKKPKEDPCKKQKDDPCKKSKEDASKKPKEDPCKKPKDDPSKSKQKKDPCGSAKDPKIDKMNECVKKRSKDSIIVDHKEDASKKPKEDPCKKQKDDPCKKKDDPCEKKEDPCKKKDDPCKKSEQSAEFKQKKEAFCKEKKDDPCGSQKEDPCKKKEDPCKKQDDPCKKKDDPCKKKDDPCKKKDDPCKKKDDPCKKKDDPCKSEKEDPCKKQDKKKDDPCKSDKKGAKEDPCKKSSGKFADCKAILSGRLVKINRCDDALNKPVKKGKSTKKNFKEKYPWILMKKSKECLLTKASQCKPSKSNQKMDVAGSKSQSDPCLLYKKSKEADPCPPKNKLLKKFEMEMNKDSGSKEDPCKKMGSASAKDVPVMLTNQINHYCSASYNQLKSFLGIIYNKTFMKVGDFSTPEGSKGFHTSSRARKSKSANLSGKKNRCEAAGSKSTHNCGCDSSINSGNTPQSQFYDYNKKNQSNKKSTCDSLFPNRSKVDSTLGIIEFCKQKLMQLEKLEVECMKEKVNEILNKNKETIKDISENTKHQIECESVEEPKSSQVSAAKDLSECNQSCGSSPSEEMGRSMQTHSDCSSKISEANRTLENLKMCLKKQRERQMGVASRDCERTTSKASTSNPDCDLDTVKAAGYHQGLPEWCRSKEIQDKSPQSNSKPLTDCLKKCSKKDNNNLEDTQRAQSDGTNPLTDCLKKCSTKDNIEAKKAEMCQVLVNKYELKESTIKNEENIFIDCQKKARNSSKKPKDSKDCSKETADDSCKTKKVSKGNVCATSGSSKDPKTGKLNECIKKRSEKTISSDQMDDHCKTSKEGSSEKSKKSAQDIKQKEDPCNAKREDSCQKSEQIAQNMNQKEYSCKPKEEDSYEKSEQSIQLIKSKDEACEKQKNIEKIELQLKSLEALNKEISERMEKRAAEYCQPCNKKKTTEKPKVVHLKGIKTKNKKKPKKSQAKNKKFSKSKKTSKSLQTCEGAQKPLEVQETKPSACNEKESFLPASTQNDKCMKIMMSKKSISDLLCNKGSKSESSRGGQSPLLICRASCESKHSRNKTDTEVNENSCPYATEGQSPLISCRNSGKFSRSENLLSQKTSGKSCSKSSSSTALKDECSKRVKPGRLTSISEAKGLDHYSERPAIGKINCAANENLKLGLEQLAGSPAETSDKNYLRLKCDPPSADLSHCKTATGNASPSNKQDCQKPSAAGHKSLEDFLKLKCELAPSDISRCNEVTQKSSAGNKPDCRKSSTAGRESTQDFLKVKCAPASTDMSECKKMILKTSAGSEQHSRKSSVARRETPEDFLKVKCAPASSDMSQCKEVTQRTSAKGEQDSRKSSAARRQPPEDFLKVKCAPASSDMSQIKEQSQNASGVRVRCKKEIEKLTAGNQCTNKSTKVAGKPTVDNLELKRVPVAVDISECKEIIQKPIPADRGRSSVAKESERFRKEYLKLECIKEDQIKPVVERQKSICPVSVEQQNAKSPEDYLKLKCYSDEGTSSSYKHYLRPRCSSKIPRRISDKCSSVRSKSTCETLPQKISSEEVKKSASTNFANQKCLMTGKKYNESFQFLKTTKHNGTSAINDGSCICSMMPLEDLNQYADLSESPIVLAKEYLSSKLPQEDADHEEDFCEDPEMKPKDYSLHKGIKNLTFGYDEVDNVSDMGLLRESMLMSRRKLNPVTTTATEEEVEELLFKNKTFVAKVKKLGLGEKLVCTRDENGELVDEYEDKDFDEKGVERIVKCALVKEKSHKEKLLCVEILSDRELQELEQEQLKKTAKGKEIKIPLVKVISNKLFCKENSNCKGFTCEMMTVEEIRVPRKKSKKIEKPKEVLSYIDLMKKCKERDRVD